MLLSAHCLQPLLGTSRSQYFHTVSFFCLILEHSRGQGLRQPSLVNQEESFRTQGDLGCPLEEGTWAVSLASCWALSWVTDRWGCQIPLFQTKEVLLYQDNTIQFSVLALKEGTLLILYTTSFLFRGKHSHGPVKHDAQSRPLRQLPSREASPVRPFTVPDCGLAKEQWPG